MLTLFQSTQTLAQTLALIKFFWDGRIAVSPNAFPASLGGVGEHRLGQEGWRLLTAARVPPKETLHLKGS